jgi:nitrite reductase/ring-hydroxylating ferredoxin subunit
MDMLSAGSYKGAAANVVEALPARYYLDPTVFEREKQAIFYRSWYCLGHISMAPKPGSYFVGKVVDQEILVVHGDDRTYRAFYNVCRHRGHQLARGSGECRTLVCPYHAWSYDLRGRLKVAPHSKGVPQFKPAEVELAPVNIEVFCGLIFVNLDERSGSFREQFGFIEKELRQTVPRIEEQKHVFDLPVEHRCNWKASVENFSECYHCGPVHKYLVGNVIDPQTYQLTVCGRTQKHEICTRDRSMNQNIWFFWPNTGVGLYPVPGFGETLCIRHMYPVRHDFTYYHYRWFVDVEKDSGAVIDYAKHHSATTGAEDAAVAAGVHIGMQSRGFISGILLADPDRGASTEHAIAEFHRWVMEALMAPPSSS